MDKELSIEELLLKLPQKIGNHKEGEWYVIYDEYDEIGALHLVNEGGGAPWRASYGEEPFVCMNPKDENPPYNNAVAWGDTPNEALQGLYDWCVKNGFINN